MISSGFTEPALVEPQGCDSVSGEVVTGNARKRAWARLLAKVYAIDPLVCPKCGCQDDLPFGVAEPQSSAVIQDPVEIRDILAHLVKTGRAPPGHQQCGCARVQSLMQPADFPARDRAFLLCIS